MLYWFSRGPGPLVVLLHGFAGTVRAWDEVAKNLSGSLAVVAVSLPGHHPRVPAESTFIATRDALLDKIKSLGTHPVHLVGYSLGARLALAMILHAPEHFARVTLISGHTGLVDALSREERKKNDDQWIQLLEEQGMDAFEEQWSMLPLFASQQKLSRAKRDAQSRARRTHEPHALAASLRSTGLATMPNFAPDLAGCRVPVTFVVGEEDKKFRAIATAAQKEASHSRLAVIPRCGHNPLIESPVLLAEIIDAD